MTNEERMAAKQKWVEEYDRRNEMLKRKMAESKEAGI
jgi:hypothetical protein